MRLISNILNTLSYLAIFFIVTPAVIKGDTDTAWALLGFVAISFFVNLLSIGIGCVKCKRNNHGEN